MQEAHDLKNFVFSQSLEIQHAFFEIEKNYCNFSQRQLELVSAEFEAEEIFQSLKNEPNDKKRFIIAQHAVISQPNEDLSRALREIIMKDIMNIPTSENKATFS